MSNQLNDENEDKEYNKLLNTLGKLEEAHEQRVNAGIDKEDDPRVMSKRSEQTIIEIEESLGMDPNNDKDRQIEQLLNQIKKVENEVIDLLDLQNRVEKTKKYKEKKEELLAGLKEDVELLRVKVDNLRSEIESMVANMDSFEKDKENQEKKIFEQEALLRQLENQIRDLRQKLKELEGLSIEGFTDAEILDLRQILDKINKELEGLKKKQRKQDEYYAIRKNELLEKERYIEDLKKQIMETRLQEDASPVLDNIHIDVIDDIDRMMLDYVKKWNCHVPITRIGGGYYLFGTRKIYAKILNGKLVIRVGGGYMIITEFLDQYSEVEMNKIERLMQKEGVSRYEDISIVRSHLQPIWDEKERSIKRRNRSKGKEGSMRKK